MDLHHLRVFQAVARANGFTRASLWTTYRLLVAAGDQEGFPLTNVPGRTTLNLELPFWSPAATRHSRTYT